MTEMQTLKALTLADIAEIRMLAECADEESRGGMVMISPGIYRLGADQQDTEEATRRLYQRIADLPADARHELTAVMWIGRGDDDPKDLSAAVEYSRRLSDEGDAAYLSAKAPVLAEYLRTGLERLHLK